MNAPKPETRSAILQSAGWPLSVRFTRHTYFETRACVVPFDPDVDPEEGPIAVEGDEAWEFIFRCTESGEERRWGVVPR